MAFTLGWVTVLGKRRVPGSSVMWRPCVGAIILGVALGATCGPIAGGGPGRKPAEFTLKDLPVVWSWTSAAHAYKAGPYLRAAIALQELGKDRALSKLARLAAEDGDGARVIVLCRMLFTKRAGSTFRRPLLGAPHFVGDKGRRAAEMDWSLDPIALVDGVPFLVNMGHDLGGVPERSAGYLRYCVGKCDWSPTRFQPRTRAEMRAAVNALIASEPLKGRLDQAEKEFLESQID